MDEDNLRVWHIPQVPGKPFHYPVPDVETAKRVLQAIALYDLFLLENNHRVDFAHAQGVESFDPDDGEWVEWEDEEGRGIGDLVADEVLTPVERKTRR